MSRLGFENSLLNYSCPEKSAYSTFIQHCTHVGSDKIVGQYIPHNGIDSLALLFYAANISAIPYNRQHGNVTVPLKHACEMIKSLMACSWT